VKCMLTVLTQTAAGLRLARRHLRSCYAVNRKAAIEAIIEANPVATCVRAMIVDWTVWTGRASRP
jgi:hypothetical protein